MIKISEIVNDIYDTCILNEWNGYCFDPTICNGVSFDTYFLNKHKKSIEGVRKTINELKNYKDKELYKEEFEKDTFEKLELLYKASLDVKVSNDNNAKKAELLSNNTKLFNKYLKLFGLRMRFKEKDYNYMEIYNTNDEMIMFEKILVAEGQKMDKEIFDKDDIYCIIDNRQGEKNFTLTFSSNLNKKTEILIIKEDENEKIVLTVKDKDYLDIALFDKASDNRFIHSYSFSLSKTEEISSIYGLLDRNQPLKPETPPIMRKLVLKGYTEVGQNLFIKEEYLAEDYNGNIIVPKNEESYNGHRLLLSDTGIIVDYKNHNYDNGDNFDKVCNYYLNHHRCKEVISKCLRKVNDSLDGIEKLIYEDYYFFVKIFSKTYSPNKRLDAIEYGSEFRKTDYIQGKDKIK